MVHKIISIFSLTLILFPLIGWIGNWDRLMKNGYKAYLFQDYDTAMAAFQEAALNRPDNSIVHYNLGSAFYKKGKFQRAANAFQTALLKGNIPNRAAVYYNLGNAQFQLRDLTAAIESYRAALRLNPQDVDAKHNLALALELLATEQPPVTQKKENKPREDAAKTEPHHLSAAEINQLLEQLNMNENKRRQQILKKQLNTGIRRAKDW